MALGLLWKPTGLGSQDALARLKRDLALPGRAREGIGHTGVLDPFAEGWLLCGTEEGTKLLSPLAGLDKTYETTMLIGWTTPTLDATAEALRPEGTVAAAVSEWTSRDLKAIEADVVDVLQDKTGTRFEQVPPQFSAVHVDGKRAYDWARKGIEKELKAKTVEILSSRHLGVERGPEGSVLWHFQVQVSAGTYVRSLARDWASELAHFPGHLTRLVRLAVGPFGLHDDPSPWKPLAQESLKGFFDIHYLTAHEAERLKAHGQWNPRPHPKACLLVGPGDEGPVAWTEAGSGKIGRVFRANPLV